MASPYPKPADNNEAQLGRFVIAAFREHGWKVSEESSSGDLRSDVLVSGHGKKLVLEIKRASEGRKDRVIPLLAQAALDAGYRSRRIATASTEFSACKIS